ncbi:F-box protein cpr30 [Phtheirospermum japonicum]|uniref:F-box protein cpr30 n=1 Tax=Phtheirospermum japonicum TaxID=374723 RepID=A0A830CH86_9LAMI|nr:F-box protein cpr30 [Phtheirospermum japonicum]
MSDIPPEIITAILIRLPVKSLLRSRCVSKPWRSLIDGQDFIKQHLRHSVESSSYNILVLEKTQLLYVDLDSLGRLDTGTLRSKPQYVVGSCDGLVLFLTFSNDIVLWNPSTRKLKELPTTPRPPSIADSVMAPGVFWYGLYALGYDSKHGDYKVVWVDGWGMCSETKIYSLKTDSWKKIVGFPYSLMHKKPRGVYLNDAVHTVVRKHDKLVVGTIMAFSIEREMHYEVMMPPGIRIGNADVSLDVIGDCLSVVCNHRSRVVVWVMREYGVKESWTKLVSICSPAIEARDFVKPLVYSREGDRILLSCDDKRLVWYDLEKKTVEVVSVDGMPFVFYAEPCVESLVSFKGPVEVKKLGPEKIKTKKIRNRRDDFLSEGFKLVL